jgi:hypothetical protein
MQEPGQKRAEDAEQYQADDTHPHQAPRRRGCHPVGLVASTLTPEPGRPLGHHRLRHTERDREDQDHRQQRRQGAVFGGPQKPADRDVEDVVGRVEKAEGEQERDRASGQLPDRSGKQPRTGFIPKPCVHGVTMLTVSRPKGDTRTGAESVASSAPVVRTLVGQSTITRIVFDLLAVQVCE